MWVVLQTLLNGFQHEQPDYWLTFGNPWEIERLIVSYPIKFYGHVSTHTEEGRQVRGLIGSGCAHMHQAAAAEAHTAMSCVAE